MALYHIAILALVQGLTEFLPISSSGHLVLTSQVLGLPDQGLAIDIAVHVGTLLAVVLYFWRDMWLMAGGLVRLATGRGGPGARLALYILAATLPVCVAGFFARDFVAPAARDIEVVAWATIGFGLLLWAADRFGMTVRRIDHLSLGNAIFIGLSQVVALIPGASRSGITMTAGRMLGMERAEAARFSLLLSIPTIIGAATLVGADLWRAGQLALGQDALLAAVLAFFAGLASIAVMIRWLERASFAPFVAYRLLLGAALLYWIYA